MITLRRVEELADKTRAYKVLVDGTKVGDIRSGEAKQFPVPAGRHTLQLKMDWVASQPVDFDVADASLTFECGNNATGFSSLFRTKDYMWLRQVG